MRVEQRAIGVTTLWWRNRLPLAGLLLALSAVWLFPFPGERGWLYSDGLSETFTTLALSRAANLSAERGFVFTSMRKRADGTVRYDLYNRFPIGAFVLIKLSILPFEGDSSAQLVAARVLMLAFFCAAAVLAYLALARLTGSRAVALGATLLTFSSYHLLVYSATVSNDGIVDLFAVMLVFHGMVLFKDGGGARRFWQLAVKVCAALLLGWHVYGLLLPFLVFCAAQEAVAAWRQGATDANAPRTFAKRLWKALARVLGSRCALLGALALLFGTGVLGYNITREHAVFDGQRAVAELPSVRSMLRRTGFADAGFRGADELAWPTFFKWQFHRVGALCLPFALAGGIEFDERAWRKIDAPYLFWGGGVIATLGCFAGLALFRRPRAPPAALALAGFCWALLARGQTAWDYHQFEGMFHLGVPLCLFAAVLLALRRRWRQVAVSGAAVSVVVFAGSSVALGLRHSDDGEAQAQQAQMAEFDAIATTIRGRTVWVAAHLAALGEFVKTSSIVSFLTTGSYVQYADTAALADPAVIRRLDFVLAFERYDVPALLTPDHRFVFLYQAGASAAVVLEAMGNARREEHRRLQALPVVARSGFDIHVVPSADAPRRPAELAYLKAPCELADTDGRFALRLVPANENLPQRARLRFEFRDHIFFNGAGVVIDDKCVMRVPLPTWAVANVYTGQFHPAGGAASWRTAFRLDIDRLREALHAVRGETPSVRGEFDLYMRRDALLYTRAPCAWEDVRRRFFLHIVPAVVSTLPATRRPSGFDNLDFAFGEHGALVDGACVATVPMPDYDIARLRTGQFETGVGVTWQLEFEPDATLAGR